MAYSSGTFSRLFDWTDDRDNGIKIRADRFDQELDGFATGLSTALLKDGTQTATAKIPFAVGLSVIDNQTVLLGTNSDIAIQYDESTNDSLEIAANVEGAALGIVLKADQGDDNADQHKLTIADGGTLTLGSKISGSFVSYLTHTPNATVASSTLAVAGNLTVGGNTTVSGNATVTGDLTISGDDLTMATNTAGALLIADGTNFNPTAVGDLSEISTVANDDVFLAVDTSGGGLKKITRSAVVAGLATSSAISNVSEDSTPQLGGNLDLNGNDIVTTSNATLDLAPNGTGTVVVRGNTNSGAIVFNCESNSHGQTVKAQPHSAGVTNTMLLPAGANSTLVSLVSADTLTNKTLTAPTLTGTAVMADLDISGDVDVDGTLEADAITIGGTAIASVLSPVAGGSSIVTTGALNAGSITSGFGAIDNGASAITTTGVITGGTLEATTDTAAGDNAAIGYTSAEGLILTGQGSTSDVVIKNDADATVVSIATGTTILTVSDDVNVVGRATGTMTTDNDGNLDLAVSNNFKVTTGGDLTLTLTNPAIGQSGNILFINGSNHTISAHASILINADVLTAISATGSYHLTYYATATSGNNTILVSASAILT